MITSAQLLAGVTDVDGPAATITMLSIASGLGTLVNNGNGTWNYTPVTNDSSSVNINYTASDGTLTSSSTASLDITPVNDAPVATPVMLTAIAEDSGVHVITSAQLLAGVTDVDGLAATVTALSIASGLGTLVNNDNGSWNYTPATNDSSSLNFNYTASDGTLTSSSTASLDITPTNDAPGGTNAALAAIENTAYTFATASFGYTDGNDSPANTLQSVTIASLPLVGQLRLSGIAVTLNQIIAAGSIGNLTWVPPSTGSGANFASFTFRVTDNGGTANGGVDTDPTPNTITFNVAPKEIVGTANNDTLTGTAQADIIRGLAGNDTLNGAAGADAMYGGTGDDTYNVDNVGDTTNELSGEGTADRVIATINWTLNNAYVENLTLGSTAGAINGTGNAIANTIVGNGSNNTVTGAGGNDTLDGGAGTDTMVLSSTQANYDMFALSPTQFQLDDVRTGSPDGTDTFTLFENIQFSDGTVTLATLLAKKSMILGTTGAETKTGTTGNDRIFTFAGNDTLNGGAGIDYLDGGTGADTFNGGAGNDTFIFDNVGDALSNATGANDGTDTIRTSVSLSIGGSSIGNPYVALENVVLTGTSAINLSGTIADNTITGNSANNIIDAYLGHDRILSGAGNDTLTGGVGSDTFVFRPGYDKDVVTDFALNGLNPDHVEVAYGTAYDTYSEVMSVATQVGSNTVFTFSSTDTLTLQGITKSSLVSSNFLFA